MKLPVLSTLIALSGMLVAPAWADEPVGFQEGFALLNKYNCQTCHAADRAMAGPSLHAIAAKYASDPHARAVLGASILNGSAGVWGSAAPMPPTKVPAADLKPLVDWILSLKQY